MTMTTRSMGSRMARPIALGLTVLLLACGGVDRAPALDARAVALLELVREEQPDPAASPLVTYNYRWAQLAMAWLAADRNGYMSRDEALTRLKSILDFAERCERRGGFWYDGYDRTTARATSRNVHFQGWWLHGLMILGNAYPELKEQCDRLLAGLDYTGAGGTYEGEHMYNPATKMLAAEILPNNKVHFEWSLFGSPAGEGRTAYVAYSYVTGDIEPFLFATEPAMQEVEGHRLLKIWMQQNFEFPFMHYAMHDVGYYEKSYAEWMAATRKYLARTGMWMVPIRQSFLHTTWDDNGFPCTEHRESMSFITWALDPAAPVWEAAWIAGKGICRYLDNWNFYWSALGRLRPATVSLAEGRRIELPVRIKPMPEGTDPARLDEIRFPFLAAGRPAPLVIGWNDRPIARVVPGEDDAWSVAILSGTPGAKGVVTRETPDRWCGRIEGFDAASAAPEAARWVAIEGLREEIAFGYNNLQLWTEGEGEGSYTLLRYDQDLVPARTVKPRGRGDHELADGRAEWKTMVDNPGRAAIVAAARPTLAYDFAPGGAWAQMARSGLMIDASAGKRILLDCRLEGEASGLEVKLIDADGSTFVGRLPARRGRNVFSVTPDSFVYGWGGKDRELDWTKIAEVAVVALGAPGQKGRLTIDRLALADVALFDVTTDSAPAMEIIARGQREGVENPFAFLARISAVHDYRVAVELERDERYLESLVAWVGPYTNRARLARWVHNLGAEPVEVEYTLPEAWRGRTIRVVTRGAEEEIPVRVEGQTARWTQPARATAKVSGR